MNRTGIISFKYRRLRIVFGDRVFEKRELLFVPVTV
jgi:hypothetical protein